MHKKYYDILKIPVDSDQQVIKRAYRKLVVKYHPDKNDSPKAVDKFLQITDAYEILTGQKDAPKAKQFSYNDFAKKAGQPTTSRSNRVSKERAQEAQKRYEFQKQKEKEEEEIYYKKIAEGHLWKRFKIVMILCTVFSCLFILDNFLPSTITRSKVTHANLDIKHRGLRLGKVFPAVLETNEQVWLKTTFYGSIVRNPEVRLEKSRIFHDIKRVYVKRDTDWRGNKVDFSVTGTFPLVPLFLLIPLITYFTKGRTLTYSFLFNFSLYFFGILMGFLILSNDRWAHLLTLGFL